MRWAYNAEKKGILCQEYTETHKDQRDDKGTGNGGGIQKIKHVDGDFPRCMRRKSEDNEAKPREMKTQEVKNTRTAAAKKK